MESALESINGVTSANADSQTGKASVTYDPDLATPESIVAEFNGQGFYTASVDGNDGGDSRDRKIAKQEDGSMEFMPSGRMSGNMMCRSRMF